MILEKKLLTNGLDAEGEEMRPEKIDMPKIKDLKSVSMELCPRYKLVVVKSPGSKNSSSMPWLILNYIIIAQKKTYNL